MEQQTQVAPPAQTADAGAGASEGAAASGQKQGTLLFVDDERNILSALRRLFRPLGYQIFLAESGKEGLEILEREPIDVIVSDMRMPQMDGAAFLAEAARRWPRTMRMLLTGYADLTSTIDAVNKGQIFSYMSKPWDDNDITLKVKYALEQKRLAEEKRRLEALTRKQNEELKDLNATLESKVAARTGELQQTVSFLELAQEKLNASYADTVKVFATLIDMRIGSGARATGEMSESARQLALELGCTPATAQDVMYAALLHDIGRISLPDKLLRKPFNLLTGQELATVQKTTILGEAALMALEPLQAAAKMIRHQHERHDGKGFPDGLRGNAIPLGARALAVVRDYFALQQGALVPERLGQTEARDFLQHNRGKRYDPITVDTYLKVLQQVKQKQEVTSERPLKSNGLCAGMVLARNLVTRDGILLLSSGSVLTQALIEKVQNLEQGINWDFTIYVRDESRSGS